MSPQQVRWLLGWATAKLGCWQTTSKLMKRQNSTVAGRFCMLQGITAEQNEKLQAMANAVEDRLFHRRFKNPDKLLNQFRTALREQGFLRLSVGLSGTLLSFRALVGKRLENQLCSSKYLQQDELLHGRVTRAARSCGLDPRIEDIGVMVRKTLIEGHVSPVPFIELEKRLDEMVERWNGRRKRRRNLT